LAGSKRKLLSGCHLYSTLFKDSSDNKPAIWNARKAYLPAPLPRGSTNGQGAIRLQMVLLASQPECPDAAPPHQYEKQDWAALCHFPNAWQDPASPILVAVAAGYGLFLSPVTGA
jgi:hypothetical protein